jgi:hypothetical protein
MVNIEKTIEKIKIRENLSQFGSFLSERNGWILFAIFFASIGYCAYLWYGFIYNPKWDETKKQAYTSTKEKEAIFSREKFDRVIADIESRKMGAQNKIENIPDIFQIK